MLKGTLDDFTLADIFRLATLARRTGKLEVVRSAGRGEVFIRDGEVYYAESSVGREPLGQKLIRAGALSDSALMKALDENASTGKRVGEILVESGAITIEQLEESLRAQIEDAVFDLLRWDLGEFTWEPGVVADVEVDISVSVENLIIEASRRLDELEIISRRIPSVDTILRMAPRPPEGAVEINITPEEWQMLVLVNGERSVGNIAETVGVDDLAALRSLYGLVSAGLVEVLEGAEAAAGPGEAVAGFVAGSEHIEEVPSVDEGPVSDPEAPSAPLEADFAPPSAKELEPEPEVEEEPTFAAEPEFEAVVETESRFVVESESVADEEAAGPLESESMADDEATVALDSESPVAYEAPPVAEHEPALEAPDATVVAEAEDAPSVSDELSGFSDLELDPEPIVDSLDPTFALEPEAAVFPEEAESDREQSAESDREQPAEPELDAPVEEFDRPEPEDLESQTPVPDPFLSELLGDGPVRQEEPATEEQAGRGSETEDAPMVPRSDVVRELAGLFEEDRPTRSARDRKAAPEGEGDNDGRKRVEDDDELNKGLIGRLIDGVKGL
jgi:hypothetical protein